MKIHFELLTKIARRISSYSLRLFDLTINRAFCGIIVEEICGDFWNYRNSLRGGQLRQIIYDRYMNSNHFFIGAKAQFAETPVLPHGLNGIHISSLARIGKNVTIFQQVTIGSNSIPGHSKFGAPTIGDNVYIGAGAKIIGNITIGDNCRIGANAVVVKDMPPNTVAVSAPTRLIHSNIKLENEFNPIL